MRVLVLGGTRDAVDLAGRLHRHETIDVIYSIVGRVRQPDLPCRVINGGFSRRGGLDQWLRNERIDLVLDATHPYASAMSRQAACLDVKAGIRCWRYLRPAWRETPGDRWQVFHHWESLLPELVHSRSVFFAMGRLPQGFVDVLSASTRSVDQKQWLRSATAPSIDLPSSMTWVQAIGPFGVDAERQLLGKLAVDAIVCKNSGGKHSAAKLAVARERGLPVYLLARPELAPVDCEFDDVSVCHEAVLQLSMEHVRHDQ